MLEEDVIIVQCKKEFDENADNYFVNMLGNRRTLHKTNSKCSHSKYAYAFIPFSSEEEVLRYELVHKNATPFHRCSNCFKNK